MEKIVLQPMSLAPRDGTTILVWTVNNHVWRLAPYAGWWSFASFGSMKFGDGSITRQGWILTVNYRNELFNDDHFAGWITMLPDPVID